MSGTDLAEAAQAADDLGAALVYDATGWHLDFDPTIKARVESLLADHDAPRNSGGGLVVMAPEPVVPASRPREAEPRVAPAAGVRAVRSRRTDQRGPQAAIEFTR